MQKYLAEFIGTFALTSAVLIALGGDWTTATPLIAGLTLGLFVYTLGAISGAHFNPAVTFGVWSIQKIPAKTAALYIVIQLAATLVARFLVASIYPIVKVIVTNSWPVFVSEMIGATILAFRVSAVVFNRVTQNASGLTIGSVIGFQLYRLVQK